MSRCEAYMALPLKRTEPCTEPIVPKILHGFGKDLRVPDSVVHNVRRNPQLQLNWHNEETGYRYIKQKCGDTVAAAFKCMVQPEHRSNIFRFCALYADGGYFLENNLFVLNPINTSLSMCDSITVGHDYPQTGETEYSMIPGYQMKMMASAGGGETLWCMLNTIVGHVRNRAEMEEGNKDGLTGPLLLHHCATQFDNTDKIAITYWDTRQGSWPYSGMLGRSTRCVATAPS
jgi:hypothetical protein